MSNFLKVGFNTLFFLVLASCTDSSTTTRNYKIVNGTTDAVELHFYEFPLEGQNKFVFTTELDGPGLVIERTLKTYALDFNTPIEAFKADSIALIFNNERVEGHTFSSPMDNSMLDDYERNGGQFTYTITEENFNNATPCDEPCN
ncbi:hypothetical protein [Flagellimonas nanhaiensis]|uniref:Uncharacterized protein n=1 Tax=Flagellimonas nanhaiensis TaxID=2292706 RepID=A0A371JQ12_9FLAO|nr:hypothetical protein [Allomuricauda nanhaiensis]RDY59608.1 hypothetical protein DX873_09555 [Allomuricauda nanhaiensis]